MTTQAYYSRFRERVRYEELLLVWLDRINQAMQQTFKTDQEFSINVYNMVRSIFALYNLLPKPIRQEIDRRLGTSIYEYLDVTVNYFYFSDSGRIHSFFIGLRKDVEKIREKVNGEEAFYEKWRNRQIGFARKITERAEEVVRVIVDILYEHGLLFREEYYLEGVESEA